MSDAEPEQGVQGGALVRVQDALVRFAREARDQYAFVCIWLGGQHLAGNMGLRVDLAFTTVGLALLLATDCLLCSAGISGTVGPEAKVWDPMLLRFRRRGHCVIAGRVYLALVGQFLVWLGVYDGVDAHTWTMTPTRDWCYLGVGTMLSAIVPFLGERCNCFLLCTRVAMCACVVMLQNLAWVGTWNVLWWTFVVPGTLPEAGAYAAMIPVGWLLMAAQFASAYSDPAGGCCYSGLLLRVVAFVGDMTHFIGAYSLLEIWLRGIEPAYAVDCGLIVVGVAAGALCGTLWVAAGFAEDPKLRILPMSEVLQ